MLDDIDREAEREGQAILKSRSYSTIPRNTSNNPKNRKNIKLDKEPDILRILNIVGGKL
ncbi:hypothetical protein LCGC14_1092760 [marine sediment metagenome]|uniref:Uncharacterized protein n=1 Tax=marine sediment metagenome TaxID=412755 RepID=A0A0F9MG91_9ZZZZ